MAQIAVAVGANIGETAVSRVADEVVDSVWRQISYVWNYKSNIQDLKKQLNKLKDERQSMQHRVDEAKRNGELIEDVVTNWFQSADEAIDVAEQIIEENGSANKSCFIGCCPNLKTRYQFSRKAKKHVPVVAEVQGERSSINRISYIPNVQELEPLKDYEALESRTNVLNEIVGALKNVDFNSIGVYGMAGVGKTTLVTQHLIDEVKRDGIFKVVTWAKVTQTPDLKRIQEEIAAWLGLKFDINSAQVRALRLCARLKQEEKVLVILDDIWTRIKLEEIGIPNDKDSKGCKILMTSRSRNVLLAMDVQKYFRLQVLQREEAWQLFQKKLGNIVDSNLQHIALQVAERCAGLPGLIAAVATALRSQELQKWKDSLERLKQFDHEEIEDQVNSALELSYNFLKADAQLVFLLCGQNGPLNIDVKYLLKYGLGLGIFKSCNTTEAARNRLHSLVNDLKASCLLLEASKKDGVLEMHDLVYNFAITVASKDQPVITSNRMREWPDNDTLQNCKAIVLADGGTPKFFGVLNCPKLRFFLLNNEDSWSEVGHDFFVGMKGLRVLNLKNACLSSLPSSLEFLKDLQTLCLDSCVLKDIAIVGKLKKLQVLSLVNCSIVCLPKELQNLTHLQLLDLNNCSSLEVIEPDVLSSLTNLEELHVENSFLKWEDNEGNNGQRENANLTELEHLSKLVTVHMHIIDSKMLPKDLHVKQFEDFKILIGEEWHWSVEHKTSRMLKLKLNTSDHLERVKGFLMRTEDLYLDDLKGVENVVDNLNGEGFPQLKHLLVQNSPDIHFIIDWRRMGRVTAFPSLESLSLNNLNKLETICSPPLRMRSFGNLRRLKVGNCSLLRNLFSFSMFRGLEKLEEIDVSSCKIIKMIVGNDDDGGEDEAIKLEQLQTLTLDHLPQFGSFCSQVLRMQKPTTASGEIISGDELETPLGLFNDKIEFPNLINLMLLSTSVKNIWSNQLRDVFPSTKNLTSLIVDGCWNLGYIFASSMVQNLAQLEKLEISNCSSMREVIVTEGLEEEMLTGKVLFRKLNLLKLKHLPKLERFCSGNLIECPSLKVLRVESCPYLQTFVSSLMQTDVGVMTLFDEKVSFPKLEELQIFHMHRLATIWKNEFLAAGSFEKLEVLKVKHAKELLQLFPSNMLRRLRNLETLVLENCEIMEQVFDMEGLVQMKQRPVLALRNLNMQNLPKLKRIWNGNTYEMETLSWSNLRVMTAFFCPGLKSLFPASVATNLVQLEELALSNCVILEELIGGGLETFPTFVFPKLKFLELWRLDELRNFYPGPHTLKCQVLETLWVHRCPKLELFALESPNLQETSTTRVQSLFYFSQVVPNLKKMTLSYKDAMLIKQGQLPTHLFQKLEELELECFHDESSYLPFELLQRFQNIKKLFLLCSDFEEIFPSGLAGDDQNVGSLTQIRYLKLNFLTNLRRIWNEGSKHKQVLQNLDTLEVVRCHGLMTLEPSFGSFQKMTTLDVRECHGLVNLFKSTTAKSLVHLRTISIKSCNLVKEIVATEGDEIQTEISLSKLESLRLHCLKNLGCFSLATCPMKFPSLTEVIVTQCPKMKFFSRGNFYVPKLNKVYVTEESDKWHWVGDLNSTIKQLYEEMVGFNGIQHLKLSEFPELKEKWLAHFPVNFFYNLTSLVVDDSAFKSLAIPSNLLPFLIALERLEIRNCDLLEKLFELEWPNANRSFGYLSNLKEFRLIDLLQLRIVWDEIPKNMLDVKNITLLKFHNCSSLRNILTPTMCLGLVQLKNLQVTSCLMVDEIITPSASEDRAMGHMIVFPLLECIIFKNLPNLTSFYSGTNFVECPCLKEITIAGCPQLNTTNRIVDSKAVSFPHLKDLKPSSIDIRKIWKGQSLTSLVIDGFRNLKSLFPSSIAKSLLHLKKVEISNCEMLEQVIVMEGHEEQTMRLLKIDFLKLKDLPKLAQFSICKMLECPSLKELQIQNCPQLMVFVSDYTSSNAVPNSEIQITTSALFDEKVAFPNLEQVQIIKMDNLRMIWSNQLHSDTFVKLEVLKVEYAKKLLEIFPHFILERLQNIKDLVIKNCGSLEEVFDIHGLINAKAMEKATSQLKTLDIRNLPNLRCVWNEDPNGFVSFDGIISMHVWECPNLKSLFPFSIAKSLQKLELLELDGCGLVELVTNEKGAVEEALMFVFPQLKNLDLWNMKKLEWFFRGIHILDCPVLKRLSVYRCDKLEVFTQTTVDQQETQIQKSMLSFPKIISNMEHLSLTSKDAKMIKESQFPPQFFNKLKVVELHCFHAKSDDSLLGILKLFHEMDKLYVKCSTFKELFPCGGLDQALQKLKILNVGTCGNLISVLPSSASFCNLTTLDVHGCNGLMDVLKSTAAKSLVQLRTMSVKNCEMVTEIVANKGDEMYAEITLTKLQSLKLHRLKSLSCFSFATCTLNFPSLTEVIVTQCPKMKFFSSGILCTPQLKKVCITEEIDKWRWIGDLNTTIQQLFLEMVGLKGMQHLRLSEFPELKEKWLGQLPVNFFYNLSSLVVDDCTFHSVAIPSSLLPFLIALEKLEIRNCDLLENLFDVEWQNSARGIGYLSNIKEFQLINLPLLRYAWDEVPKGMLDMKNLTLLKFHNCSSLRNVLTCSMCRGLVQLKKLQVTSCDMLEEIISATAVDDRTEDHIIVFTSLESVIFKYLPNVTNFYSGTGSVECPCLKEITIVGCPQLNFTNTIAESKVYYHKIWNCQSLTSLMVDGLRNLKFLFPSSIAKSLMHLQKIEISDCEMLEQVIALEGQDQQMMSLPKTDFLKLKDLPKLTEFSSCNMLECPSMKELQIQNCPQLVAFISKSTSSNVVTNSRLDVTTSALFDEKVAFPNLEQMQIIKMDNLRMIWSNQLHSDTFVKLEVLKVEYAKKLLEIFPHFILERLQNIKDLVLKNCDSLEEVFDIHGLINTKEMEKATSQLKTLDIRNLPNLRCVWNEDPNGLVSFDELSLMYVWECPNLKSLFPFSITKSLQKLELLELDGCGLVELVTNEKGVVEEAPMFVFPQLKNLDLWNMKKLECFFRGIHILDCPLLKRLSVYRCDELEVFTQTTVDRAKTQIQKSMFSFSKIISNMEHLSLTSKDAEMIKESQFPPQHFNKLNAVELNCFHRASGAFPSDVLKLFYKMENLYVKCSMFKELYPFEGLDQTLKILNVQLCHNLTSLAPSSASFQNLTNLDVHNCKGLVSLVALSTARSLVQLLKMSIKNCDNLSEIVANEGSNESEKEIVFTKLQRLELHDLRRLVSFSSVECSFKFSSLTQVIVSKCPNIKFFSKGVSTTPKLQSVQFSEADKGHWNGSLNTTVQLLITDH